MFLLEHLALTANMSPSTDLPRMAHCNARDPDANAPADVTGIHERADADMGHASRMEAPGPDDGHVSKCTPASDPPKIEWKL